MDNAASELNKLKDDSLDNIKNIGNVPKEVATKVINEASNAKKKVKSLED